MNQLLFSPGSVSLQVWPSLTKRFYLKELDEARAATSNEKRAALPHLEVLVDKDSLPLARLAAARGLRMNQTALPAAITVLMELVFDDNAEIAYKALAELAAIDHPEATKGLHGLTKWGSTKQIRTQAAKLIYLREQGDCLVSQEGDQNATGWIPQLHQNEATSRRAEAQDQKGVGSPHVSPPATSPFSLAMEIGLRLLRHDKEQVWWFPSLVLLLTTIAEILTLYPDPRYGVLVHITILFLLFYSLFHAVDESVRRFNTVLLLIPLIRILSLALPLSTWPQITWYFAASVPLFAAMMTIIRLESWSKEELGWKLGHLPTQMLVIASGIALGWMEYKILTPDSLVSSLTWQSIWLPALILLICTGYMEELLFRGLLQSAAISVIGRKQALLFGAAFFAVMHIGYASILDVLFVFAVGLLFAWFVDRTNSIFGVTIAHGLTNIGLFLVWPLLLG